MKKIQVTGEDFLAVLEELGEFFADISQLQLPRKIFRRRLLTREAIEDIVNGRKCHLDVEYSITIQPAQIRQMLSHVRRRKRKDRYSTDPLQSQSAYVKIHEGSLALKGNRTGKNRDA